MVDGFGEFFGERFGERFGEGLGGEDLGGEDFAGEDLGGEDLGGKDLGGEDPGQPWYQPKISIDDPLTEPNEGIRSGWYLSEIGGGRGEPQSRPRKDPLVSDSPGRPAVEYVFTERTVRRQEGGVRRFRVEAYAAGVGSWQLGRAADRGTAGPASSKSR